MPTAIIMAGGRSLRMRASMGSEHKALVKVLGVPMLERNLLTLLSHGFQEIFVAVSAGEASVLAFARGRANRLAHAGNAKLRVLVEKRPLGTIGAARAIRTASRDVLVVNVDNLTVLDLSALLKHHRAEKAAMTVATHIEPFKMPFGQVSVKKGGIVDYKEKPVLPVVLSSGVYVLGKEARLRIPPRRAVGAHELVHILLREKRRVGDFPHSSPWIDVNDSASVDQAEELIMTNFNSFELWRQTPEHDVVVLCVVKRRAVAVLKSGSAWRSAADAFPAMEVLKGDKSGQQAAACLQALARLPRIETPHALASFDELDERTGTRTRYHVLVAQTLPGPAGAGSTTHGAIRWVQLDELSSVVPESHGNSRTVAYLRKYIASQNSHSVSH